MSTISIKKALISVSDKTGIVEFAKKIANLGVEIISTGGTSQLLREAAIPHRQVEELTGLSAMLDGRVKTLHPKIHGGILGKRDAHAAEALRHQIDWIDLVVVNFYPFAEATQDQKQSLEKAVEWIDIGGPTMVRAAAKNVAWVGVVTDPADYTLLSDELAQHAGLSRRTRLWLAEKAFAMTSSYDAAIHAYFANQQKSSDDYPLQWPLQLEKKTALRYGENPHQRASAYQFGSASGVLSAKQYQGKPLSYNNILDAEAALNCVSEFDTPACVIVKHANPCGVAVALTIEEAFTRAHQADPKSAFGGIIALNRPCTKTVAAAIANFFVEVVLAPSYDDDALSILKTKQDVRVLAVSSDNRPSWEMKFITGGVLLQDKDVQVIAASDVTCVTQAKPTKNELDAMLFAWRVLKHVKSNGILIARDNATVGIGAGQVSRVDAVELAIRKAGERVHHAVLASDAFFPFRDSIDLLAPTGIRAIIQPGGAKRDHEVIAACDEQGIAMVFTGKRCFKH